MPDILSSTKLAMRLTRDLFDPEIYRLIDAAVGDLALAGVQKPERSASASALGVTATVDAGIFAAAYPLSGSYVMTYTQDGWTMDGEEVDPEEIGVTVQGTPSASDTVTVRSSWSASDPLMLEAIITYVRLNFGTPDDFDRLKRAYAQCHWGKEEEPVDHMDTRNHARLLECIRSQDMEGTLAALRDDLNDFGGLDRIFVK